MADDDRSLTIRIGAVADELEAGLNAAGTAIKEWADRTKEQLAEVTEHAENFHHLWTALFEFEAAKGIVEGFMKIVEGAARASDAMELAANTARNMGKAFDGAGAEKFAEQMATSAQGGGASVESLRAAIERFIPVTRTQAEAERATAIAANLAAARHIDLSQATEIVSRVLTGHVAILSRYGIATKDAAGNTLTTAQMMEVLASSTKGAAEILGNSFSGQVQRTRTEIGLLAEDFGKALLPAFTAIANAVRNVITSFRSMSPQAMQLIASIAAVSAGVVALVLSLGVLGTIFPVIQTGLKLTAAIFTALTSPIGLVIVAIGALVAAFVYARTHPVEFANAVHDAMQNIGNAIGGMVDFVKKRLAEIKDQFQALGQLLTADFTTDAGRKTIQSALARISGDADKINGALIDVGQRMGSAIAGGVQKGLSIAGNYFKALLTFHKPEGEGDPDVPDVGFGNQPTKSKTKDTSSHDASEAWKNEEAAIKSWLRTFQAAVDAANAKSKAAANAAENYRKSLPDEKPQNAEQGMRLADLDNQAAIAARAAADASNQKAAAENHAAAAILRYLSQIPKTLKNYQDLKRAAEDIAAAHERAATAAERVRDADRQKATEDDDRAAPDYYGGVDRGGKAQTEQRTAAHQRLAGSTDLEASLLQFRAANAGPQTALQTAQLAEQLARLKDVVAQDAEATAADILAIAKHTEAEHDSEDNRKAVDDAQKSLAAATIARVGADTAAVVAQQNLNNQTDKGSAAIVELIDKFKIAGLTVQQNGSGGIAASFNPMQLLLSAFSQTKEFADVQKLVNELMKTFAGILDALRPVLDLVLDAVAAVANVFITLWNVIARLLRVLGIHIPLLETINTDFGQLDQTVAPLISVTHDLPTSNELATGQVGTLSPNPTDYSTLQEIQQPTIDTLNSPNLGGGLLGGLAAIVVAVEALKLLGGSGGAGGILGSISGVVKSIFGGGASSSATGYSGPDMANGSSGSWGTDVAGIGATGVDPAALAQEGAQGWVDDSGSLVPPGLTTAAKSGFSLSGALAGAGIGLTEGSLLSSLLGPGTSNSTNASIGGALGGGLGGAMSIFGLAAGPLGALAGGALGSLLGGLFGPHETAAEQPDINATQAFGQGGADLQGSGVVIPVDNVNGQQFTEDAATTQATGGVGLLAAISSYIKSTGGKGLTTSQLSEFSGLNTTGGNITGGGQGNWTLQNGYTGQWQSILDDAQSAMSTILQSMTSAVGTPGSSTGLTGIFAGVSTAATTLRNNLSGMGNALAGNVASAGSYGAAAAPSTSGDLVSPQGITLNTNIYGDVNGIDDVDAISASQADALQRRQLSNRYAIGRSS